MLCPHCRIHFHDNWATQHFMRGSSVLKGWLFRNALCPGCEGVIVEIDTAKSSPDDFTRVHPLTGGRPPAPPEVPSDIAEIHRQACLTLPFSAMASAALSRRCLQAVLSSHGYTGRDLAKQVENVLSETDPIKAMPSSLLETIDGIRNFGNFSAHPINDVSTFQIIDVEPHEAEWCLDILDDLFDHFYVKPTAARAKKAALDDKLRAAGKPLAK